jgi:hypothetical protein
MKELLGDTVATWGKRKRCRYCHSTTNAEAPCCDACGFDFTGTPMALRFQAPWKGRIIAAGTGLVAAAMRGFFALRHRISPRLITGKHRTFGHARSLRMG